jgi:hypothetical protein
MQSSGFQIKSVADVMAEKDRNSGKDFPKNMHQEAGKLL